MGSNSPLISFWMTCLASYLAWWPVRIGHAWVDILSLLWISFCFLFLWLYLFYRISVDLLSKLLGLVTCENRSPMGGHTFLVLFCFALAFLIFPLFSDFPSFLKFLVLSYFLDLCCFSWNIHLLSFLASFLDSSAYLTSTPSNSSNLIH